MYNILRRLFPVIFLLLTFACGEDKSENDAGGEKENRSYEVKFYDSNLDLIETRQVAGGRYNPAELLSGYTWYISGGNIQTVNHNIARDTNFYALPNVREIRTEFELNNVRNRLSGYYILMNDITLTGATLDTSTGWKPIIRGISPFTGIFNGNGYKINGLWIKSTDEYVGLFGYIEDASIKNLGVVIADGKEILVKQTVAGSRSFIGSIAGFVQSSTITNCYSVGNISGGGGSSSYVGGIAGFADQSEIISCNSKGNIVSSDSGFNNVGGIVGFTESSKIANCYSTGNIKAESEHWNYAGGIVGEITYSSTATSSYSTGNINAVGDGCNYAGGIAGEVRDSVITNNYSIGNITTGGGSWSYTGGIAGDVGAYATVMNNYSRGNVITDGKDSTLRHAGGIAGEVYHNYLFQNNAAINSAVAGEIAQRVAGSIGMDDVELKNFAYSDMTVNGVTVSDSKGNGVGKTISELQKRSTYEDELGWRFGKDDDNPWKMPNNGGFPILYRQEE